MAGLKIGIGADFRIAQFGLEVFLHRIKGEVQEMAGEPTGAARNGEFVVRIKTIPTGRGSTDEPQTPFRIPGVADPLAEIVVEAIYKKAVFARFAAGKEVINALCKLGRKRLIGI